MLTATISALILFFGYCGLPFVVNLPVFTSMRTNFPFFRIARSQEQEGLSDRNTSQPFCIKSTATINSEIAPTVELGIPELGLDVLYFFFQNSLLHANEQYLCIAEERSLGLSFPQWTQDGIVMLTPMHGLLRGF